jgi:hypothetical protein
MASSRVVGVVRGGMVVWIDWRWAESSAFCGLVLGVVVIFEFLCVPGEWGDPEALSHFENF